MSSTAQQFNCIFCKETFENKEDLQIHFRKHGDPKFNQKGKSRPPSEAETSEKKINETEMVRCDVCPEMFPTISKAITHKHKVHPDHDAKYFCPWCGKLFTMKHLYNKHLQSNHENLEETDNAKFHCEACNVDFYVPSAMLYHNKFFHRQDTDLPTIGQSKKLRMCQQEAMQIYYCAFCGDEYDNKVNLHKHMGDDHGDENQSPEDVLKCPLCEAIFYHLDAYEVHLTFHTTEDLYSENNEMFEQITEFSLETVPPVSEKVENVEPQEDVESAMNAVGIEKFLEMAMGNTDDNDGTKSKSKKHKKHKKKKKEAITLDEFLNMNQDVFGEGLDFQGIEEVPTQVVARRLKQKKGVRPIGNLKVAQSSELEKLKKQGIVVKLKATKKPPLHNFKIGSKLVSKSIPGVNKPSTHVQTTPDDVLSKLINQSNSQIKIVKRSTQNNLDGDQKVVPSGSAEENTVYDKRSESPENIEVECDVNMPSEYTSSENETKEDNIIKTNDQQSITKNSSNNNAKLDDEKEQENVESTTEIDIDNNDKNDDVVNKIKEKENAEDILHKHKNISDLNPLTALRNSANITIKSQKVAQPLIEEPEEKTDELDDKNQSDSENEHKDLNKEPENSTNNSLNALKHLSHLITVKSVTPKISSTSVSLQQTGCEEKESKNPQDDSDQEQKEKTDSTEISHQQTQVTKKTSLNSLNSIKNLSKNITIKPVIHSPTNVEKSSCGDENEKKAINKFVENNSDDNHITSTVTSASTKNFDINLSSPKGQNIIKNTKAISVKEIQDNKKNQSNVNLLKHLTNVTAKPVNSVRSNIQQVTNSTTTGTKQNIRNPQNLGKKQETNEDIEIFNIDDSDDELENKVVPPVNNTNNLKPNPPENKSTKSLDSIKNISKHITVKPVHQQAIHNITKNIVKQNNSEQMTGSGNQCSFSDFSDEDDDNNSLNTVQQKLKLQNNHLKTTLRNLGKHITIKSGIPSPNASIKSGKDQNSRDNFETNDAANSDDSCSGKVKITEMNDDNNLSDDDMGEQSNKHNNSKQNRNITVTSPEDFNSDPDNFDKAEDDDFPDLEHQIKANTLKKPGLNINKVMNLKNMNNVTIKSLTEKKGQGPKESESNTNNIIPNINSELSLKPFKQIKLENLNREEASSSKKMMNAAQVKRSIINQNQSMNQSMASSSQQNTVNKEVTVKTFQTKTIIQEITTTVTKTIKTVNQTVKQEVQQSSSQNNLMKFQKAQEMKSCNQQIKSFQGVTVRHATPVAGTKIRGGAPSNIRPSNQIVPCNQLVPIRPVRNTARMSVPRMPVMKRTTASGNPNQPRPNIGRPLKISPNAVSSIKRPIDEPMGHFSCFKKPKESLIPVSEIPAFGEEQEGESMVQFSSSQMSKSNFTSATKTVRGNTLMTQVKSEVNASSQQLEKLNSMSGLKVIKTSQSKQSMKVEEKCEMSPSKRNALEAIEKLQKQGLLVKKPRVDDVSNESNHSDDGHDYITEEPDD